MSFSVVIPLYNKRATVARALRSVQAGDPALIGQIVVVDDGSTDGSGEIVAEAAREDPRIELVATENRGVSAARNLGVERARAGHILFLDADDEWLPGHAGTIAGLLRDVPGAVLAATAYRFHWSDGATGVPRFCFVPAAPGGRIESFLRCIAFGDPPVWTSAVAVRRDAFSAAGGFPEGVSHGEDKILWLRLAARGPVAWSPQVSVLRHETAGANSLASWTPARGTKYLAELADRLAVATGDERRLLGRIHLNEIGQIGRAAARGRHFGAALRAIGRLAARCAIGQALQVLAIVVLPAGWYTSLKRLAKARAPAGRAR